jgi:hypothetical protein
MDRLEEIAETLPLFTWKHGAQVRSSAATSGLADDSW